MATGNTGFKGYSTLEQYYTNNGSATGVTKANTWGDPDYIAPVYDLSACPKPAGNTYFAFNPTGWLPDFAAQSYDIGIDSDYTSYTLTADSSWISVVNAPSGGSGVVLFRILKNVGGERYGNILVYSGGITIGGFSIIQGGEQ
jgi:hypothetical protein